MYSWIRRASIFSTTDTSNKYIRFVFDRHFLLHSVWIQYEKRRYVRKDSIEFWYISNDVFEEVQYHPTSVSKRFVNFDGKVCEWNIIHDIFQNALFVDITKEMRCAFVQTVQYVYITFLTLVITKRIRVPYITAFTQIGCKSKVQGHATSHCRWLHIAWHNLVCSFDYYNRSRSKRRADYPNLLGVYSNKYSNIIMNSAIAEGL